MIFACSTCAPIGKPPDTAMCLDTVPWRAYVSPKPFVSHQPVLVLGEHVAHFSASYPIPLCDHIAGVCAKIFADAEEEGPNPDLSLPLGTPPAWMGQLARSLKWKKLLQYEFKRRNHINVNEHLSYRSLMKHLSKTEPHSRFCTLLDSRVIIGCNAKGRSSSKQLNFYLGSTLPYIIGGDLYPFLLHVGTGDNASDDISRFIALRDPTEPVPPWLLALLSGDPSQFDQVRQADSLQWPYSGWARLMRLMFLRHCNQEKCDASTSTRHC